jgi:F0F1-type ATP synthase membrane subunit a
VVLFLFEIFIAFIQAFIFAILSAVYVSGALEEEH